jgi:lysophospholipase L1-like esterase
MKLLRSALLIAVTFTFTVPLVRADEIKPADPAVVPAPVKPVPPQDEPTVPSAKGANAKQIRDYTTRADGFIKDKEAALANGPIQLVTMGDSITDGWHGRASKIIFDEAFGKYNPLNTGISGDRTQHLLWRMDRGELDGITPNPRVAMLMIGTNNTGPNPSDEAIADGIKACVEDIHKHLPKTKVLLLGVFPRNNDKKTEAGDPKEAIRGRIKHINEIISKLDDGGKTVKYLDIGDKFLTADGSLPKDIMPDYLHPNAKGYQIWADAVKGTLDEMMK